MNTPKRWLDSEGLSADARDMLQAASPTPEMPPKVALHLDERVAELARTPATMVAGWTVIKGGVAALAVVGASSLLWPQAAPTPTLPAPPPMRSHAPAKQVRFERPPTPLSDGPPPQAWRASSPRAPDAPKPPGPAARLAEELRILDAARRQLALDPTLALRRTEEHLARFPRGQLSDLRDYVEIQALHALGERDRARARAARFLSNHPRSTFGREVGEILADEAR